MVAWGSREASALCGLEDSWLEAKPVDWFAGTSAISELELSWV